MNSKYKFIWFLLPFIAFALICFIYLDFAKVDVLNPKGWVALKQRDLIIFSTLMMLIVVIPVFILTFVFLWRYREGNEKAKYNPDWNHSHLAESIWWGIPCLIILVLSIICWKSTYQLDPFKPLETGKKPVKIQVVALQWKWLFIYPEQQIATVNFFQIPEQRPIHFEITSDAPMNSFWIPQLAGQVFAMSGMRTKLHLIADEVGEFRGCSANISGKGFSGMHFIAKASTEADFDGWVQEVAGAPGQLGWAEYTQLAKPSEDDPVALYRLTDGDLFDQIIMKYMAPMKEMAVQSELGGAVCGED